MAAAEPGKSWHTYPKADTMTQLIQLELWQLISACIGCVCAGMFTGMLVACILVDSAKRDRAHASMLQEGNTKSSDKRRPTTPRPPMPPPPQRLAP